jgi:hypothetical protein
MSKIQLTIQSAFNPQQVRAGVNYRYNAVQTIVSSAYMAMLLVFAIDEQLSRLSMLAELLGLSERRRRR